MDRWLGLMIGNSRLHWAYCSQDDSERLIQQTWDCQHLVKAPIPTGQRRVTLLSVPLTDPLHSLPPKLRGLLTEQPPIPLLVASVVPDQTQYWQTYANIKLITLKDMPLANLYPTLGIDRALAVLGVWHNHQTSALVIDGGTALTLTGVDTDGRLIGGAILPGLGVQLRSLHQQTAALPDTSTDTALAGLSLLPRWQTNTTDAIRSGVWYSLLAGVQDFIRDWLSQYPDSDIVFTGGDGGRLWDALKGVIHAKHRQTSASPPSRILYDPHVIFKGMAALWNDP